MKFNTFVPTVRKISTFVKSSQREAQQLRRSTNEYGN